jgi:hypothetical protein
VVYWYTSANTGATEEYDGSTWTSNPNSMGTARHGFAGSGAGTQTAALGFGGNIASPPLAGCNRRI